MIAEVPSLMLQVAWNELFPVWMIRRNIPAAILRYFWPRIFNFEEMLHTQLWPLWLKKVRQHELTLGMR